jgi:hypothetical protein
MIRRAEAKPPFTSPQRPAALMWATAIVYPVAGESNCQTTRPFSIPGILKPFVHCDCSPDGSNSQRTRLSMHCAHSITVVRAAVSPTTCRTQPLRGDAIVHLCVHLHE